ncbi:MAG: hypothetical protein K0Q65_1120 [Clostridia bacterium]|jgi:hypothetical protein|nr:hypothetical protein [Clostridia bacterium]
MVAGGDLSRHSERSEESLDPWMLRMTEQLAAAFIVMNKVYKYIKIENPFFNSRVLYFYRLYLIFS